MTGDCCSWRPRWPPLRAFLLAVSVLQNARGTALFASTAEAPRGSASSAEDRRSYPRLLRRVEAGGEVSLLHQGEAAESKVDDHHPPHCREAYTCNRHSEPITSRHRLHRAQRSRIAVYTYNIGGYEEMRDDFVPCVPPGVDAFLFLDELGHSRFGKAVKRWRALGWHIMNFTQMPGTKHVSGPRLTSKSLKFTPPNWLLNGTWQWLVEHDGNIVLDLHKLKRFLRKRKRRSLVLLNWGYHTDCSDDGFDCFMTEVSSMLTERVQYVASSKENVLKWKDVLQKMHVGKLTHGGRKYAPPNYYETNVIFRNLKHKQAGKVRDAFEKTYLKCQDIQRDQFLLPFFLWQDRLTPNHSTEAIPMERLVEEVGYCMVDTRVGRN